MKIFDLHADTLWRMYTDKNNGLNTGLKQNGYAIDILKLKQGNVAIQTLAVYNDYYKQNAYAVGLKMIDLLKSEISKIPELSLVGSYSDLENNLKNNKISVLLSIEDGCVVERSLSKLRDYYNRGVRMIGLNHNYYNGICYPNYGKYDKSGKPDYVTPDTKHGLSEFGLEMIKEMNRLGIVVDLSHSSDKGFYDAIKTSCKPVTCSHSNARAVCSHIRNLSDDMLKKLADNGGVTGINFVPTFLKDGTKKQKPLIECIINHIKHIKKLVGIDTVALGSDLDGFSADSEFKSASDYVKIPQALFQEGFTDTEVEKICYKNALRVFKENIK